MMKFKEIVFKLQLLQTENQVNRAMDDFVSLSNRFPLINNSIR